MVRTCCAGILYRVSAVRTRLSKATNCCRSLAAKEHRQHGQIKFAFGLLGCDTPKTGAIPFSGVPTGGISVAVNRSDLVEPENFGSDGWNLGSHGYELARVLAVLLAAGTPSLPKMLVKSSKKLLISLTWRDYWREQKSRRNSSPYRTCSLSARCFEHPQNLRSVKCTAKSQLPQWLSLFSPARRRCLSLRMLVGRRVPLQGKVLLGKLLARVPLQGKILQGKLSAAPVRHIIRAHRRLALLD
jgi:hypothetical protein